MKSLTVQKTSLVLLAVLAASSCSITDGAKKRGDDGLSYGRAMDAMYPSILKAMKATMPKISPEESSDSAECGGIGDNQNASKLIGRASVSLPGAPTDARSSSTLVDEMTVRLSKLGWKVEKWPSNTLPGKSNSVVKHMRKPGYSGGVSVSAYPFRLASGKISQSLTAQVVTGCLRNPKWISG
ncbi:hypothetical protein [Streptomyces sp. NBC_00859]|uniref:hypothetical protein n=1 Tax=Streptomyces sp. NBC_00859 TaxID=2903682 RepID=UPI0038690302|nr:hypothetical protein OG584_18205 [Streptomyces sp. NBC_00859]